MRSSMICLAALLCLLASRAHGQEAREYLKLGLESSLACKKIDYYTRALQLEPTLAEAYEKRGLHYYFQGRLDRAIRDYTRVIELKPRQANAYQMRGLATLKKGHKDGCVAELHRLASRYLGMEKQDSVPLLKRAIDDFSRAIKLDPQMAAAYSYRAEAYRFLGMKKEAMRDATRAIQLRGDRASMARAYATRAEIYKDLGRKGTGEANFRKAVDLNPYSSDYPPLHVPLLVRNPADAASLESLSRWGLLGIIVLCFVGIFKLAMPAPRKRD